MLSQASRRSANAQQREDADEITVNGTVYRRANVTRRVNQNSPHLERGALIDGGANGGVLGNDARVLTHEDNPQVQLTGIANMSVQSPLKICTGAALTMTVNEGPIILLMPQYAELGEGKTIHSKAQLEHFGALVDDTAKSSGGNQ